MKLVILFGPPAVGKMTVGQELAKLTGLKLFHNHMTIDLVSHFFSYSTPEGKQLVKLFRQEIFEAVAKSDLYGMIFTYVWNFDQQFDWNYIANLVQLFEKYGAEVYMVELEADVETRLERNKTPNRLEHKRTKRDIERSENSIKKDEEKHRMQSLEGEIPYKNYLRINNTHLSPEEVAKRIQAFFTL